MNEHIKTLFVVLSLVAVTALLTTTNARAQTADWTLRVRVNNVNFGESTIGISIKGPYGYSDYRSIPNGPSPSATFTIPGNAIPAGAYFKVCAGTGILGALLPNCSWFVYRGAGSASVRVTP
jgi:hypothetical protein